MREGKSIFGVGGRIATTSDIGHWFRNDIVNKKCRVRRDTWVPPYGTVCRGGRPCPPAPDNVTPCRAGPVCPAGCGKNSGRAVEDAGPYGWVTRGCGMSGRCRHRPLRKRNKRCNGRATARVAPTKALQRAQEKNPPVTASPCQPPLGKEAKDGGYGLPHQ